MTESTWNIQKLDWKTPGFLIMQPYRHYSHVYKTAEKLIISVGVHTHIFL